MTPDIVQGDTLQGLRQVNAGDSSVTVGTQGAARGGGQQEGSKKTFGAYIDLQQPHFNRSTGMQEHTRSLGVRGLSGHGKRHHEKYF